MVIQVMYFMVSESIRVSSIEAKVVKIPRVEGAASQKPVGNYDDNLKRGGRVMDVF